MYTVTAVDEIMWIHKKPMLYISFVEQNNAHEPDQIAKRLHFEWFDAQGLTYEAAEFHDNLDGGKCNFIVNFNDPDDPRIQLYSDHFEDENFKSLEPLKYQMYLYEYHVWYNSGGRARIESKDN